MLLDCVDNPQCTQAHSLQSAAFTTADALLVQTMTHRQVLRSQGMHAAVWPHPHGNFMGWSPSGPPRDKVSNVGLTLTLTLTLTLILTLALALALTLTLTLTLTLILTLALAPTLALTVPASRRPRRMRSSLPPPRRDATPG